MRPIAVTSQLRVDTSCRHLTYFETLFGRNGGVSSCVKSPCLNRLFVLLRLLEC